MIVKWIVAPLAWVGRQFESATRYAAACTARSFQRKYRYVEVDELPDHPARFKVYVAGTGANAWAAAMVCPCGCKDVIELNLLAQVRPCWQAARNIDGTATLSPSVWRQLNCRSHFFLRNGRIRWC